MKNYQCRVFISLIAYFTVVCAALQNTYAQNSFFMPSELIVGSSVDFYLPFGGIALNEELDTAGQKQQMDSFSNAIIEGLISGSITAAKVMDQSDRTITASHFYDSNFSFEFLTHNEVLDIGKEETRGMIEIEPGLVKDTTIVTDGRWKSGLQGAQFFESWEIDDVNQKFIKKIKCVTPFYGAMSFGMERKHPLCAIPLEYSPKELKKIKKDAKHTNRITYGYNFVADDSPDYAFEKEYAPFLNYLIWEKLVDYIFELVEGNTKPVYDFYTNKRLSGKELTTRMQDEFTAIIEVEPGVTKDTTIIMPVEAADIKTLIFIEDWYVSKEPFMIFKEVVGIAPVRNETNGGPNALIPFVVYFKEN